MDNESTSQMLQKNVMGEAVENKRGWGEGLLTCGEIGVVIYCEMMDFAGAKDDRWLWACEGCMIAPMV